MPEPMSAPATAGGIRNSFAYQFMVRALKAEPDWTPQMHCVYNDYSDELTAELCKAYREDFPDLNPR